MTEDDACPTGHTNGVAVGCEWCTARFFAEHTAENDATRHWHVADALAGEMDEWGAWVCPACYPTPSVIPSGVTER